jgi:hypothetical protein
MNSDQGGGRRRSAFVALLVTSLAQAGPVLAVEVFTPGLELPRGTLPEPTPPRGATPVPPPILTGCHMVLEVWIGPRGLPARTTVRLLMHSGRANHGSFAMPETCGQERYKGPQRRSSHV